MSHTDLEQKGRFRYWIPPYVTTTIDKDLHRAGDLQLVVDHVFTRGGYRVESVVLSNGGSDHWAILAHVNNNNGPLANSFAE